MLTFWTAIALLSVLLIVAVALTPSTTIVDRLGLYLIPIQLLVFGNLPSLISNSTIGRLWIVACVVAYYGLVLFVWLNFATHAEFWLPYKLLGQEFG